MTKQEKQELNRTIKDLKLAENSLLDLDLEMMEKMAEEYDLDVLHTANILSEIVARLTDLAEETL